MLKNKKFGISNELYEEFRDVTREVVEELSNQDNLYAQTLREYLYQLGKILFTGDKINESEMVSFMAVLTEYLVNKEIVHKLE